MTAFTSKPKVDMPIKIVFAEDHPVVLAGIQNSLSSDDFAVVGHTSVASEIPGLIESLNPDVLVMESRLGNKDALKILESFGPQTKVQTIVFSGHTARTHIARAASLGCYDYILKSDPVAKLADSIRAVVAGEPTPEDSRLQKTRVRMRSSDNGDDKSILTTREMHVLRHVSMGLSNREVGKSLGISVETVKEHVQNILRKLNVNDRTQAAVWAVRKDLI